MRPETNRHLSPRMNDAVRELQGLISASFPDATFVVEEGFDPEGIYVVTTVDIPDTDDVIAAVGDRLVDLQVDKGLAIYVTPLRPIEHVVAQLREWEAITSVAVTPLGQSTARCTGSVPDAASLLGVVSIPMP